jgi:hypothetical protein
MKSRGGGFQVKVLYEGSGYTRTVYCLFSVHMRKRKGNVVSFSERKKSS